jgi:hypothetical protein
VQEILILDSNFGGIIEGGNCTDGNWCSPYAGTGVVLNATSNSNVKKTTLGFHK